jgi:GDPmannose 4,6-dehydratase
MKTALITGVTGQSGSYLAELLVEKDYKVYGLNRRTSSSNTSRLSSFLLNNKNFQLVEGDLCDPSSIHQVVTKIKPNELYNLGAQSHVATSFEQPTYTFQVNAVGTLNCLEAIRINSPETRFYQASTSEMFGDNFSTKITGPTIEEISQDPSTSFYKRKFQDENTPLSPNSPYAVSKVAAHNLVQNYRRAYNIHASCGILFNHESPRRGENFVTRKITKWLGEYNSWRKKGNNNFAPIKDIEHIYGDWGARFPKLRLGNLDAKRDWGHAKDYVCGMWTMLQQDNPDDYVLSTGETHSIREFLDVAFTEIGISDWGNYIVIDPAFIRPSEVPFLLGNSDKARNVLGWKPEISFTELVKEMVTSDLIGEQNVKNI